MFCLPMKMCSENGLKIVMAMHHTNLACIVYYTPMSCSIGANIVYTMCC